MVIGTSPKARRPSWVETKGQKECGRVTGCLVESTISLAVDVFSAAFAPIIDFSRNSWTKLDWAKQALQGFDYLPSYDVIVASVNAALYWITSLLRINLPLPWVFGWKVHNKSWMKCYRSVPIEKGKRMSVGVGRGRGHVTMSHTSSDTPQRSNTTWSVQCWDSLDQVDHLILLPERALTMDSQWLQADLAEIWAQSVMTQPPTTLTPNVPTRSSVGTGLFESLGLVAIAATSSPRKFVLPPPTPPPPSSTNVILRGALWKNTTGLFGLLSLPFRDSFRILRKPISSCSHCSWFHLDVHLEASLRLLKKSFCEILNCTLADCRIRFHSPLLEFRWISFVIIKDSLLWSFYGRSEN